LVLIAIQNDREWAKFCHEVLLEPDLPHQPGFESNTIRVAHRDAVDARVGRSLGALDRETATARLRAAQTAFGFVNDLTGLATHPALRRARVDVADGSVDIAATPVLVDGGSRQLGKVPHIGEHTDAIRAEIFG
jgi:crotonobetainyl-CoA:carnitine CoA-transferase CaiB-like acyl-CoA transferase